MKEKRQRRKIIIYAAAGLVCLMLFFYVLPVSRPEKPPVQTILAERISPAQIRAGDRIVVVSVLMGCAVSEKEDSGRIGSTEVTVRNTATREVITRLSEDTAVFEVIRAGEEDVLLKSGKGYLTSSETDQTLYYADEPELCSSWRFTGEDMLYNPCSGMAGKSGDFIRENYLSSYNASFSVYRTDPDRADLVFSMAFYRMGNSRPFEALPDHYRLPVFQTSDIHGNLADLSHERPLYLLACIYDKILDARGHGGEERRDKLILLDCGDIYQGSTLSSMFEGQSVSELFVHMGYDAVTIGNHDFDWGIEKTVDPDATMIDCSFDGHTVENSIPVLFSNLYRDGEKVPFAKDYIILEKTAVSDTGLELPIKVAVIGFSDDYSDSVSVFRFSGQGYRIDEDYDRVNLLAASLEESGQCDATVLIAHSNAKDIVEGLGSRTAVDLVLGGHVHKAGLGKPESGPAYIQPGGNATSYTSCSLLFSLRDNRTIYSGTDSLRAVFINGNDRRLMDLPENADWLDASVVDYSNRLIGLQDESMETEIGFIREDALRSTFIPESGNISTTCGNWVTSIFRRAVDADVGFYNKAGIREEFPVESGAGRRMIKIRDIYSMLPFDTAIHCYELSYGELLTALQYAVTEKGRPLLGQMSGIDCYYEDGNVLALVSAGGEVIYRDGEWTDGCRDRKVRVAVGEFSATTDRTAANGMGNPFAAWSKTDRLIRVQDQETESAVRVLTEEAAENDGLLYIDTSPHYINHAYVPRP